MKNPPKKSLIMTIHRLLERTILCGIDHRLRSIEEDVNAAVLSTTGSSVVVSYGIIVSIAHNVLQLRIGHTTLCEVVGHRLCTTLREALIGST